MTTQTAVFIIRTWIEPGIDSQAMHVRRFRLEEPRTGQHWSFLTLEALHAFMAQHLDSPFLAGRDFSLSLDA